MCPRRALACLVAALVPLLLGSGPRQARASHGEASHPAADAGAADACGPGALSAMEAQHPDQVAPEPESPGYECIFAREVRCFPPFPTLSAYQMAPFSSCPRTVPRWSKGFLGSEEPARFSRLETRRARLAGRDAGCGATPEPGPCCYLQFTATACR